jgi:hypothetical protein
VWHQHGEVQPPLADESDRNDDEDQMDDMIADIGRGYVGIFYTGKIQDGQDLTFQF